MGLASADEALDLLDWKRRIFALYADVRASTDHEASWRRWCAARDELFRSHPSSPLPQAERAPYQGVPYFDFDPALRVLAEVEPRPAESRQIASSGAEEIAFDRIAVASFELDGAEHEVEVYWLAGYGGGLFVPFRDATSGAETYGGGRYLLDTVKGSDLGMDGGRLVLDFNFVYNPSCSYDPRWVCPLSPPANRLPVAIRAGERMPVGEPVVPTIPLLLVCRQPLDWTVRDACGGQRLASAAAPAKPAPPPTASRCLTVRAVGHVVRSLPLTNSAEVAAGSRGRQPLSAKVTIGLRRSSSAGRAIAL